jgi:hypothetical protein
VSVVANRYRRNGRPGHDRRDTGTRERALMSATLGIGGAIGLPLLRRHISNTVDVDLDAEVSDAGVRGTVVRPA